MALLALGSSVAVLSTQGEDILTESTHQGAATLVAVFPKILIGIILAGFAQVLLLREQVAKWFGERSGLRGIILATAAGIVSVGGPMTSFPLLVALARAGADFGVLIAFLTAWALLGIQRIIIWELPLLGSEFTLLRFFSCLVLPIIAGLVGRHIVFDRHPPSKA